MTITCEPRQFMINRICIIKAMDISNAMKVQSTPMGAMRTVAICKSPTVDIPSRRAMIENDTGMGKNWSPRV